MGATAGVGLLAGCSEALSALEESIGGGEDTLRHEADAELSTDGSSPSGWAHYGYDRATTNNATAEQPPEGWVQPIWRTNADAAKTNEPFVPVPVGNRVLVETKFRGRRTVVAVDAESGDQQWEHQLSGGGIRNGSIVGETAFFTGEEAVSGVSLSDGTLAWERILAEEGETRLTIGCRVTVVDGVAYLPGVKSTLLALDARTGEQHWSYGDEPGRMTPAVAGNRVFIADDRTIHALPRDSENSENNEETAVEAVWTYEAPGLGSVQGRDTSLVVDREQGLVFAVLADRKRLLALSIETGEPAWAYDVELAPVFGRLAVADATAYLATERGIVAVEYGGGEPKRHWTVETRDVVMDAPTIVSDTLYVSLEHGEVRAIDRATGETLWQTYTQAGTSAQTSPVVHDGRLYVGTDRGTQAFERRKSVGSADTGSWPSFRGNSRHTGSIRNAGSFLSKPDVDWIYGIQSGENAVLSDGIVVFKSNTVVAVDVATGAPIWKARPDSRNGPFGVGTHDGTVIVCGEWHGERGKEEPVVQAYDLQTGSLEWERELGTRPIGGPAFGDGLVYVGTEKGRIIGLNPETGETVRRLQTGGEVWWFSLDQQRLVTGSMSGWVGAFDVKTGQRVWEQRLDNRYPSSNPPLLADGTVYLAQNAGAVYAFDIESGQQRWKQSPPAGTVWKGTLDEDSVYFVGNESGLTAFDRATGRIEWNTDVARPSGIVHDGERLICAVEKGTLMAIDPSDGSTVWTVPPSSIFGEPDVAIPGSMDLALGDDAIYLTSDSFAVRYA